MVIKSFRGKYFFLSNFYPCIITHGNFSFPTIEHAFQAEKTLSKEEKFKILECKTPGEAKRLGRNISLKKDWEIIKFNIMEELLQQKFNKEPFKTYLLDTGEEELIEGNIWHDNFYGICYCDRCKGRGNNTLGKMLMEIRDRMRA